MNTAFLLTGGNIGDRSANLAMAKEIIAVEGGGITAFSSIYETAAWGKKDQSLFLNQALKLQTKFNAKQLMQLLLKVEKKMGRIREEKYGPRIIDIDILFFNDEQHQSPFLRLPHPEVQNRRFALMPLVEIAPNLVHPVLKKSITQLLKECPDKLSVKKYS